MVGLPLPDPYSCNDNDGLVPSGWKDCSLGMEPVVGLSLSSYYDESYYDASYYNDNEYYQHFCFDSDVEWWDDEIENESHSNIDG